MFILNTGNNRQFLYYKIQLKCVAQGTGRPGKIYALQGIPSYKYQVGRSSSCIYRQNLSPATAMDSFAILLGYMDLATSTDLLYVSFSIYVRFAVASRVLA